MIKIKVDPSRALHAQLPLPDIHQTYIPRRRLQHELTHQFSTIITKENHLYVSHCPELDIASQGETIEDAIKNLKEAIELYLEDEDIEIPPTDFKPMVTVIEVN